MNTLRISPTANPPDVKTVLKQSQSNLNKKCRWCEGGACDLVVTHNGIPAAISADVDAADGMLCVHIGDVIVASRKVNYYPMCGKRIGVGK